MCDTICQLAAGVPVISFATGNPALLPLLAEANPSVVGADWRIRLDAAWRQLGYAKGIQGNLDPAALLADPSDVARRTRDILRQAGGRPGHIFNLGHGILPLTSVDNVLRVVDEVHRFRADTNQP
jgi:uroporphyrinogen decarboxylase